MELNLERPLLFFDIESTGLNIVSDSIAELSFVQALPGGETRIRTWRLCPWDYGNGCQRSMNPAASAVNGIKDEDLKDCPKFHEVLKDVMEYLNESDLAGFNSSKFDLPMLSEEIERVHKYMPKVYFEAGADRLDLHAKQMIDVQTIYHTMEPRNLKAAYRFYCGGKDFENAHTAEADTIATYEVLKGELDMYPELKNDVKYLANFGGKPKSIDYAGRLIAGEDGEPVISFGKHKGRKARDVYQTEPSYFAWIMNGEFTLDTKRQFEMLKEQYDRERREGRQSAGPGNSRDYKPLSGKDFDDATQQLLFHFGGNRKA